MTNPETSLTLIARLKRRDDELAWTEFAGAYEPFLLRILQKQGFCDADCRDILQQILLAVYRSLDRWTPDGQMRSFRRWLTSVTRNTVLKFLRYQRKQTPGQGGSDLMSILCEVPEAEDHNDELRHEYDREVFLFAADQVRQEFRQKSWTAFWQTTVEGRSVDDVATELGVERGAIYMSRSRIMTRIRARVEELGEGDC